MSSPILTVRNLRKHFTVRRGFPKTVTVTVKAVDDLSFEIHPGEAFGLCVRLIFF